MWYDLLYLGYSIAENGLEVKSEYSAFSVVDNYQKGWCGVAHVGARLRGVYL